MICPQATLGLLVDYKCRFLLPGLQIVGPQSGNATMQEGVPLHWPLINSAHMQTRLAKRELEKKRLEDAKL